jgi:hypothetical protein
MPAKLVRKLDENSAQGLRAHAAHYAANGRRFAKALAAAGKQNGFSLDRRL